MKPRNIVFKYMRKTTKSQAHTDRKKAMKRGYAKHRCPRGSIG